jgi:hypothetical protein
MKFKSNPDIVSVVETTVIEVTNEVNEVENKENKQKSSKLEDIVNDLFNHLQQSIRIYQYCQFYFENKHCFNSLDYFKCLEHKTKQELKHVLEFIDVKNTDSLPEISFDFKNDSEFFALVAKMENETIKMLEKISEISKDDFITKLWLNEYRIFDKYFIVKKVEEITKDNFCDSKIGNYSFKIC